MTFSKTRIAGVVLLEIEPHRDSRGFFARAFCRNELIEHGLNPTVAQVNEAWNQHRGTIRGLHFQYPPAGESKIVRCTRGAILDVAVDLRPESLTYLDHVAVELTADNYRALYIPERCAHGYQTLVDDTHMLYFAGACYAPGSEGGLGYDDPRLGVAWPLPVSLISDKDRNWQALSTFEPELQRKMRAAALNKDDQ
jgi:dTDP-4-dehydrorhamnose 3,5-epimerase